MTTEIWVELGIAGITVLGAVLTFYYKIAVLSTKVLSVEKDIIQLRTQHQKDIDSMKIEYTSLVKEWRDETLLALNKINENQLVMVEKISYITASFENHVKIKAKNGKV